MDSKTNKKPRKRTAMTVAALDRALARLDKQAAEHLDREIRLLRALDEHERRRLAITARVKAHNRRRAAIEREHAALLRRRERLASVTAAGASAK